MFNSITLHRNGLVAAVLVLVIFHGVGLWGLLWSEESSYYAKLTPLNLLLTNIILFSYHRSWNLPFILFATITFLVGISVELAGVHTGLIFGNYTYGEALGYKIWDVPLMIGLNWLMLTYATGIIVHSLKAHFFLRAFAGALLMVFLDFLIEPVAISYDFWVWHSDDIPVSNYLGWLGVAFILQLLFHKSRFAKQNKIAWAVYAVQALFFIFLNLSMGSTPL